MRSLIGCTTMFLMILGSGMLFPYAADSSEPAPPAPRPGECKVTCVDPHTPCKESEKVLEVLQTLVKALNNRDWKIYGDNLDDNCSTFDETKHKLITGKENVVNDIRQRAEKFAREGTPFLSVVIDQPYVHVCEDKDKDKAVVTFVVIRQFGGKHPYKEEANATDVFVKTGGAWKRAHFRSTSWKRV
jgi:hypothetical protein